MAKHRIQYDWTHTSSLLAKLHNMLRGKNSPARQPADFHPCPPAKPKPRPSERMKATQRRNLLED